MLSGGSQLAASSPSSPEASQEAKSPIMAGNRSRTQYPSSAKQQQSSTAEGILLARHCSDRPFSSMLDAARRTQGAAEASCAPESLRSEGLGKVTGEPQQPASSQHDAAPAGMPAAKDAHAAWAEANQASAAASSLRGLSQQQAVGNAPTVAESASGPQKRAPRGSEVDELLLAVLKQHVHALSEEDTAAPLAAPPSPALMRQKPLQPPAAHHSAPVLSQKAQFYLDVQQADRAN